MAATLASFVFLVDANVRNKPLELYGDVVFAVCLTIFELKIHLISPLINRAGQRTNARRNWFKLVSGYKVKIQGQSESKAIRSHR